jgi:hypothetical protein
MMILNPVNDIFRQAHQGSVAAIIQVLNDRLASTGVRTRAIFANGILQLLCEASTPDQLDRAILPDQIRKILESIGPRNIRRVNINSRIVREQQLLWLEEINRDPDGQLLWAQEIVLRRPNPIKAVFEDLRETFSDRDDIPRSLSPQAIRDKRQFTKGILGGVVLSAAILATGWGVYSLNGGRIFASPHPESAPTDSIAAIQSEPSHSAPSNSESTGWRQQVNFNGDDFTVAVRIAERAAVDARAAKQSEQWRTVAEMWGEASKRMASVPQIHPRFAVAKDRAEVYRKNQQSALTNAK